MSSTTLAFDILARDRGASRTFTGIGKSAESGSRGVRLLGSAMKYTALGVAGGVTAAAALGAKLAKSAAEDQVSARALALQQRNSADATRGQIRATEDWITVQGKALGVTDDELRPALGKLVAATHDVTKARRLASLAEDVAAGRGKSLSTVTEALAKAQLGSLGGLARLGVRTKDAAGNTLTLKQVTQDLANTYRGQAAKAADTASGRYNRLKVMLSETGEAIGYKLLPPATELAGWILDKGVPLAERFAGTLEDELGSSVQSLGAWIKTDGIETAREFGDVLTGDVLPALKSTGHVVGDAVGFFNQLPGPVKSIGIEAGIAALVMPRLSAGVDSVTGSVKTSIVQFRAWRTELAAAESGGSRATTMLGGLKGAAGAAAGTAGLVALTQGAHQSNGAVSTLLSTLGGAATGFSLGGPIGALIGGAGGGLLGIVNAAHKASDSADNFVAHWDGVRDTLDQVTGATTQATRAYVYDELVRSKAMATLSQYGVTSRTAVAAILGNRDAIAQVTAVARDQTAQADQLDAKWAQLQETYQRAAAGSAGRAQAGLAPIKEQMDALKAEADQRRATASAIREGIGAVRADTQAMRERSAATRDYTGLLKGLPPRIKTQIRAEGIVPTMQAVIDLNREFHGTPKQIRTTLKAAGFEGTRKQVQTVQAQIEDLNATRPDLGPALRSVVQFSLDAKREAIAGATGINRSLSDGTGKAKANLGPFAHSVTSGLGPAKSAAWTGGLSVGDQLQAGVIQGFSGTQAQLSAQAAAAVNAAIASARQAGEIHSPSRKTHKVGQQLGDGLLGGLRSRQAMLTTEGVRLLQALSHGIESQERPLKSVLDRVSGYVDTWQNRLKAAQSASRSFAAGFQNFSTSVFSADLTDQTTGAGPTVADILGYARQQRSQAGQVRADVAKLQQEGISTALLKQLQAAGPSGLAQIHALATNASLAQIRQLGALDKATRADLAAAGTRAAGQVYGSRVRDAAQHLGAGRRVETLLQQIEHHLRDAKGDVVIQLDGRTIRTSVREHNKKHGRKDDGK